MSQEVMIHPKAIKELERLPDSVQGQVMDKLRAPSREFSKSKSKLDVGKVKGTRKDVLVYRFRVEDHRVVFEFSDNIIWVAKISHRTDSYRGL